VRVGDQTTRRRTTSGGQVTEQIADGIEHGSRPRQMTPGNGRGGRWRTVLAWTVTGSWGAWAIVRLTGADRFTGGGVPVVPLLSFTPYVAAAAPLPVVGAALLRRRRAAAVAGIVAVGLLAAVVPRAVTSGQPAAQGPRLRVLSANLQFSLADPAVIVDLARRTGADVLSVQELTPDGAEALARAGLTRLLPYQVVDTREGPTGSGLYSRHRLRALPPVPGTVMAMPRAELVLAGDVHVEVTAVHPLPPLSAANSRDWRHGLDTLPAAAERSGPQSGSASRPDSGSASEVAPGVVRLLVGDYNATLDHARFRELLGRGYADAAERVGKGLVPTWGVGQKAPPLTIDHIIVDRRVAVRRVEVYALPGSDHRALFAELRLPRVGEGAPNH
jgi:endonuclease/exonuclease/phosphatase (EEP) superfamily protein YafD